MRTLYSFLLYLLTPVILLHFVFRGMSNRGYLRRWGERFGRVKPPARQGGFLVHAVSVGEVNAASGLIRELRARHPTLPFHLTTATPTGSERVRALFGDTVSHSYLPFDLPAAVRRFLDRISPQLVIVMETEIWPNLYREASRRGTPVMMANARISPRSLGRYYRLRKLTRDALKRVSAIAAQTSADAGRLAELGADPSSTQVTGNLKFDLQLPPGLFEEGESIRAAWGPHRPILVAGSTHEDDEIPLLRAWSRLLPDFPGALLVIVPRHPERFARAAQMARASGLRVSLRSEGIACPPDTQCFVIDSMGELLRFYATGDIAFVGGSLADTGGHNVLEPAALARPVLVGPHTENFADIVQQLLDAGGALRVADADELETALRQLFSDPESRDRMGRHARQLVRSGQGAVERTLEITERLLTAAAG